MRSRWVHAGLLSLALVLAGCGGGAEEAPSSDPSASPSVSLLPSPPGTPKPKKKPAASASPRDDLADLAEKQATQSPAQRPPTGSGEPVLGADISWPQCPEGLGIPQKRTLGAPMPIDAAEYVVIGLTNGPGFYPNPCLAEQVAWVRDRRLMAAAYAVASYPDADTLARYGGDGPFDGSTSAGALRNTGYQQARFNIASMRAAGFESPIVWVDVEPVPDFEWSSDVVANAAVVVGAVRGYEDAGYDVGVYSTPYLWEGVVGDLSLGVPEWRAAGQTSREEALERCGPDWVIQGGPAVLGQWVEIGRDMNVTCPGISTDLGRWFHQY